MKRKTVQRFLSAVLTAVILLSVCAAGMPTSAAGFQFSDVNSSDWFYDAVNYCVQRNYMDGVGNNRFQPAGKVTRAQVAQVLYNREGKPYLGEAGNLFKTDIKNGDWFYNAVVWCGNKEIVTGTKIGSFSPDSPVTRQDICVMVYRYVHDYLKLPTSMPSEASVKSQFSDWGNVSAYARAAIRWGTYNNFIRGSGKKLNPRGTATRGELAQFLLNLDSICAPSPEPSPTTQPTPEPSPTNPPANEKYEITYRGYNIYKTDYDTYAYAIVEVLNTSSHALYLDCRSFDFEDGNGHLVATNDFISNDPDVIAPGEKGYFWTNLDSFDGEELDLERQYDFVPDLNIRPAKEALVKYGVSDISFSENRQGDIEISGRIVNNTAEDDSMVWVVFVLYDKNQSPLYVCGTNVMDVAAGKATSFSRTIYDNDVNGNKITMDSVASYKIFANKFYYQYQ